MYKTIHFILFFFFLELSYSQESAIGFWTDHLSYARGSSVAEDENIVYCSTPSCVYAYNKTDNSLQRLNKINGFSDVGSKRADYNSEAKTLVIVYENCNVDLIKKGRIINISDIKRANIIGIKTINNIYFKDKLAYLSCSFGIVVLDLEKEEIRDTYYFGAEGAPIFVNDVTINDSLILAATINGIFKANTASPNLTNYNEWTSFPNPDTDGNFTSITAFNNMLLATLVSGTEETPVYSTYRFDGLTWSEFSTEKIYNMTVSKNSLIASFEDRFEVYDTNINKSFTSTFYEGWEKPAPAQVIIGKDNNYWIADRNNGLIKMHPNRDIERMRINSPLTNDVSHFAINDNDLWLATGAYSVLWHQMWLKNGIYSYKDYTWDYLNGLNSAAFDTIWDVIHININPVNKEQIYVSSFGGGLVEVTNNKVSTVYRSGNSSLKANGLNIKCSASAFDKEGNLWVTNGDAATPLSVKKADNTWKAFYFNDVNSLLTGKMIISSDGYKWISLPKSQGLLVFDDNETISDTTDDRHVKLGFSEGTGSIPGSEVSCITEDKNGYIWIGSDKGISVFYAAGTVFDGGEAQQIKIVQDGNVQLLLETETVTAIAVDGANRKWVGTLRGGAFLLSEDGTEQLMAFNTSNSPLVSNSITHIEINHKNGEVYFGTDMGIMSYKSTATEGDEFYTDVYAYPNPVTKNHNGPIAIKGLVSDSQIKITDIAGMVIYETVSYGGQAIWNGNDFSGNRAKAGVYLVFVSDPEGSKTTVTKILMVD